MNDGPTLIAAEPQLFVPDMSAAFAFYIDQLGFMLDFQYGDPTFYAQVRRDGARLNLRHTDREVFSSEFRNREPDALSATLIVEGIEDLSLAFSTSGVKFHQKLKREPWGAQTFIVCDPGGNLIAFAG